MEGQIVSSLMEKGGESSMNGKQFLTATMFAICLLTLVLIPIAYQSNGTYDPRLDYNKDGKIDAQDLQTLAQAMAHLETQQASPRT
jgi:hypothetical protein